MKKLLGILGVLVIAFSTVSMAAANPDDLAGTLKLTFPPTRACLPIWSFQCDVRMWRLWLSGRLAQALMSG
jgi:hypothetical protein